MSIELPLDGVSKIPEHIVRFQVGELLPWKGLWFQVMEVTPKGLVLESRKKIEK